LKGPKLPGYKSMASRLALFTHLPFYYIPLL